MDKHSRDRHDINEDNYNSSNTHDSRYGGNRRPRRPSRFSDGPVNRYSGDNYDKQDSYNGRVRSPGGFRRGGDGHRPFDSPPRQFPGGGGFRPMDGGRGDDGVGGFRPIGGVGGGFGPNYQAPPPPAPPSLSGQKRGFRSPDRVDGGSFAKLFVGSVPRTAVEEDIRPLFEEHGNVMEVALIKDKRTGQQQGCCFVKYATTDEADRAIRALHNQHTLPGGVGPIQVRFADGERERLGAVEYKLFVGSLNIQATEKEVGEIFAPYGLVEDVYLMRDEMKKSRGCGFVKYSSRDMASAAIHGLNGVYTMRGCAQPLIVRFADPKRPRPGDSRESRGGPAFGDPGFGPRFQPPGARPPPNYEQMGDRIQPSAWFPMSPQNLGPSSSPGVRGFGSQLPSRSGDLTMPSNQGGPMGSLHGPSDASLPGLNAVPSSTPSQQFPPVNQQISPLDKPLQSPQNLPPPHQLHPHGPSYPHMQSHHVGQMQIPFATGQAPFSQALLGSSAPLSTSQPQVQHSASSATALQPPLNVNSQAHPVSTGTSQQKLPSPVLQQMPQSLQQSPYPLAQMLSQQTQTLQASFQSSQQAFSQLQQQLQMMQPSNQSVTLPQNSQVTKQQSHWAEIGQQMGVNSSAATPAGNLPSSTSSVPPVPAITQTVAPVKCNWTEHTSPDGFKYYHNTVTGESQWEKPEELTLFEQQLHQKPSFQQPQGQSQPQVLPTPQVPQTQQVQFQAQMQPQFHHLQQLQQLSFSSAYPTPGVRGQQNVQEHGYAQLPLAASSVNDANRSQQGLQSGQEWMWKNKPTGT
ncbi:flowering time control protein FCA-like isoform X2 [Tripterygium wilfordii]|uniref:flowering time control protein FCA-like isoform X2 n=1 Tax=Tripterygium wilfordii TaxID=458696 RepID=UPI0018F84D8D|nr:flowering time control protein FCA-like isoform X2 [Tripterygium wilfordii]